MASAALAIPNPQPLSTTSNSRQNHINQPRTSFSSSATATFGAGAFESNSQDGTRVNANMSFSMSQGSQGGGLMIQSNGAGPFRAYDASNGHHRRDSAPQIYSAVYSGVDVYEMEVNGIAVMRRRKDSWLNATQILKVAGIEKGKRTKVLEKEILIGEHEKVQGGYGKYQGTWIMFDRGLEFCRQYGVEDLLRPLLTYDMGQDGGVAGRGGIDTPTKEQAMAAQRKRLYNAGASGSNLNQSGTFFKNISSTASHAVAAISKARFDSPVPRIRNGNTSRPATFSRQSSQQQVGSQESVFPGSQQSLQSFASAESFTNSALPDSAYSTQIARDGLTGDFEEPPRKRIRLPNGNDGGDTIYDMSMREPSPTEPNESFYYQSQTMADDTAMPLAPLPSPTTINGNSKKAMLMSLFTNPSRVDFRSHEVFTSLSAEDLDMPIDNTANTALIWAATLSRLPLLRQLISKGASIYRVNKAGETALMRSCVVTNNLDMGSFPDLLELLGPTLDFRDARGRTVLHHIAITSAVKGRSQASKYYLESLLEFVVRQGVTNSQTYSNSKPFNIARFMSEIINVQDRSGDTALNIASRIGNRSIISQLMEVGADPFIPNRSNLNPQDFGIGGPRNIEGRMEESSRSKTLSADAKESSGEIMASISSLLTSAQQEFQKEISTKQTKIDGIHSELRDCSRELGESRRRLETTQAEKKVRDMRKLKIMNLVPAKVEERNRLVGLQGQCGQPVGVDGGLKLGDADENLSLPSQAREVLSSISQHPQQGLNQNQHNILASSLPAAHILRARINAYNGNNEHLEQGVKGLQSKSSELAAKYRAIISLCTGTQEGKVDSVLEGLVRAVESESDVELVRVREFLQRVGDVE